MVSLCAALASAGCFSVAPPVRDGAASLQPGEAALIGEIYLPELSPAPLGADLELEDLASGRAHKVPLEIDAATKVGTFAVELPAGQYWVKRLTWADNATKWPRESPWRHTATVREETPLVVDTVSGRSPVLRFRLSLTAGQVVCVGALMFIEEMGGVTVEGRDECARLGADLQRRAPAVAGSQPATLVRLERL